MPQPPPSRACRHSVRRRAPTWGSADPSGLDEIRPFLANVLRGRRIPPARIEAVAHHYERFGGVSPITDITEASGAAPSRPRCAWRGLALPVRVGARNAVA